MYMFANRMETKYGLEISKIHMWKYANYITSWQGVSGNLWNLHRLLPYLLWWWRWRVFSPSSHPLDLAGVVLAIFSRFRVKVKSLRAGISKWVWDTGKSLIQNLLLNMWSFIINRSKLDDVPPRLRNLTSKYKQLYFYTSDINY
jgi:hypothetical protein